MISLKKTQKTIGTLVPMSALVSAKTAKNDNGTFAAGLVFLDWLKKTGQSAWQLLPLYQTQLESGSATKHVPSPYKSYGIGIDPKYLPDAFTNKYPTETEKRNFISDNSEWLHDYALFCALRDHFGTDDWRMWDEDVRNRDTDALAKWTGKLADEIDHHIVVQWRLHQSYLLLRKKAKELHIALIGDLPFYPSVQSPLVWANQDVFQMEKDGKLQFVSGIPNTANAHFGRQIWGHPLYNWRQKEKAVAFWKMRLRYQATLFDRIRFDHAKAFFSYGVMDIANEQNDRYEKGPGAGIFRNLLNFGLQIGLLIFAEDSGDHIEELRSVLNSLKIPGIKILRFGLREKQIKLVAGYADINHYPENIVAYTTTHDTETLVGYLNILTIDQKKRFANAAKVAYDSDNKIFGKILRDAVLASSAKTVIIPIQDWLLTTERINVPGTELAVNDPNWNFHLSTPIEKLPA